MDKGDLFRQVSDRGVIILNNNVGRSVESNSPDCFIDRLHCLLCGLQSLPHSITPSLTLLLSLTTHKLATHSPRDPLENPPKALIIMVETGNAMTTTNNNAVEKKRRKRNKKNKKKGSESSHVNAVSTAGEEDDSDEDEDAILDYLNMSMSTAASGAMQSQSASSGNLAMQDLNAYQSNHMGE